MTAARAPITAATRITADNAEQIVPQNDDELAICLASWHWRIFSGQLYKILVKSSEDENDPGLLRPFLPNKAQREFLSEVHHRNVIAKARQLGFCNEENMRVLTADLKWVKIKDVEVGDDLIAVDEAGVGQTSLGRKMERKMRTATVQAKRVMQAECYRVTLDDGRYLDCTANHPWLYRRANPDGCWASISGTGNDAVTRRLKVGGYVRWITKPWEDGDREDGWFGGMLDGEGSISKSNASAGVNVSQRPGPVWDRLVNYAEARGYNAKIESDNSERLTKFGKVPVPKLVFGRMDEMFRLVGQTRPTRFLGNRFWEGRSLPGRRTGIGWSKIVSIEPIGTKTVVDIQTSTGTYIAEGFVSHNSTLICVLWLDHALWNPDQACGIVAHTREDAESLFRDKVCKAYDNLPPFLIERFPTKTRNASTLIFAHNNSRIVVKTSLRSGTYQRVHVSELGKIAAKFPEKAVEVMTGTLPACPNDGVAIIESTAEGREGAFYETVQTAKKLEDRGQPLAQTQFKLHFFPWWREPGYTIDPAGILITREDHEYFDTVEDKTGAFLTAGQRAWYVSRRDGDLNGDQELMWREFPSTLDECFQQSTAGTYYARELSTARLQRRITSIPHADGVQVHTFWDIGAGDGTGIWCMQRVGLFYRLIAYFEGWDHGYSHYVKELRSKGWIFGKHFLPHDARHKRQMGNAIASPIEILEGIAPDWTFEVVPRVANLQDGIQLVRKIFPELMFDEQGCGEGIAHLELYKKIWNSRQGTWGDQPEKKDGHSEAADALRQLAQAVENGERFDTAPQRPTRRRASAMAA